MKSTYAAVKTALASALLLGTAIGTAQAAEQGGSDSPLRNGPTPQASGFQKCASNQISLPNGVKVATGTVALVALSVAGQPVTLTFSTEIKAPTGGTVNVDYSIDGASAVAIGPEFFADDPKFVTRTALGVTIAPFKTLTAGSHTIQPFLTAFGGNGTAFFRCFTAEP